MATKRYQAPEEPAEPGPHISPEMLRSALHALETRGMILYGEGGAYIPTEKGWKLLMSIGSNLEEIEAHGNADISATGFSSIKITTGSDVKNDNSIVCVGANKSCASLNMGFRKNLKSGRKLEISFDAGGVTDVITAYGSPALELSSTSDITIRKGDDIDDSTIAIMADKSAADLNRELIEKLKDPDTRIKIRLEIQ